MDIEQVIARIKAGPNDITLYPGATEKLLKYFEEAMKVILPPDIKEFYSFSNGFESDEDLFRMIPLEEIMEDWRCKADGDGQFYFSEYLIYSDLWGIDLNVNQKACYYIFYSVSEQQKLPMTDSLANFLDCFLKSGVYGKDGLYDWVNSIQV
jgi:hypothetical protein